MPLPSSERTYGINEVFYSLQGEGGRAGEPSVFVRFRGCNMRCSIEPGPLSPGGFDCDTEFASGMNHTLASLHRWVTALTPDCKWLVLTGGEPGLQVDDAFIDYWHARKFKLAIETNGSVLLPDGLDWITVSPKVAEHAVKQLTAHEVKYVRAKGQGIPVSACRAELQYISPAFGGHGLEDENLTWCIELCKKNPSWRLSVQTHKLWQIR